MTRDARLTFVLLLTLVDDWGRYDGNPILLRSECFPLDDGIRQTNFDGWLDELQSNDLIFRYEVDRKPYIQIRLWKERKRGPSKFPDPRSAAQESAAQRSAAQPTGYGAGYGSGAGEGYCAAHPNAPPVDTPSVADTPLLAALGRLGVNRHRLGGRTAMKVDEFVSMNGGEDKAAQRLTQATDAGMDTLEKAVAWCRKQDWTEIDRKVGTDATTRKRGKDWSKLGG